MIRLETATRLAALLAMTLALTACTAPPPPVTTGSTSAATNKATKAGSRAYRSSGRQTRYARGPYWRYGGGGAAAGVAGAVIVADAIERAEVRDAIDTIAVGEIIDPTPVPDYGGDWGGGDWGGGDWGGGYDDF